MYRELRLPHNRLKKAGVERLKDGSIAKNPQRMGPLTFEARLRALEKIIAIQASVNANGQAIDILDSEEEARIRELISAETWPEGWDGDEPTNDTIMPIIYQNGAVQPLLFRN